MTIEVGGGSSKVLKSIDHVVGFFGGGTGVRLSVPCNDDERIVLTMLHVNTGSENLGVFFGGVEATNPSSELAQAGSTVAGTTRYKIGMGGGVNAGFISAESLQGALGETMTLQMRTGSQIQAINFSYIKEKQV